MKPVPVPMSATTQSGLRPIAATISRGFCSSLRDGSDMTLATFSRPSLVLYPSLALVATCGSAATTQNNNKHVSFFIAISPLSGWFCQNGLDTLLMSGRHQIVHSQVLHDLPVVIPSVREENRRCVESRSPELLDVRISYLFQQVLIRQGADCPVCMRECILQIPDDVFFAGQVPGPFLIRVWNHGLAQYRRGDFIQTECDVPGLYSERSHGSKCAFSGDEIELLGGHRFHSRHDLAFAGVQLFVED